MKTEKTERLKHYTERDLVKKLGRVYNSLDDDLLTKDLITKKEIQNKINKIIYCNDIQISNEHSQVDPKTGEVTKQENTYLYGCRCGQHSICPICASSRSDIIFYNYIDKVIEQFEKHKYTSMITFTIKDQKTLDESWNKLTHSVLSWRKMGQRRGSHYSGGEAAKIKAAIGCYEITCGSNSDLFHTHMHMMVFTDEIINYKVYDQSKKREITQYCNEQLGYEPSKKDLRPAALIPLNITNADGKKNEVLFSKLSHEWYTASNGIGINIDCRPIKKNVAIETQLREIIKYTTKTVDLSENMIYELLAFKNKKRFFTTWGELYGGNKKNDIVDTDFTDIESEENEEFLEIDSINAIKYNVEDGKYSTDEKSTNIGTELYEKIDKLKQYRIECNYLRSIRDSYLNTLKPVVELQNLSSDKTKESICHKEKMFDMINEVDCIRDMYRRACKTKFNETVNIPSLTIKPKNKIYTQKEIFYYNGYLSALNVRLEKEKRKQKLLASMIPAI